MINSGSLKEAVRASISVPGIFAPVYKDGGLLVDGGVLEPLPTEAIQIFNCNFIIASSISFERESFYGDYKKNNKDLVINEKKLKLKDTKLSDKDLKKLSIQEILDKSLSIMHSQMVKSYAQKANILIEPKVGEFGFFDFAKSEKIIQAGRIAAERKIPEIKKKLGKLH